jgi:hypothetical protein
MIRWVYSVWDVGGREEDVSHPDEIKDKDPLQGEKRFPTGFGCEESCPGDENG